MHFPKVDTFVTKRGSSALEIAFKRLEEAFLAKQAAFHSLVVRAQGRDDEGSFLICSKKSCCAVPSLEALRKNGEICPSCSGDLVERRAPRVDDRVRDETESDDDMDDDERRARGVASKRGTP